MLSWLGPSIRHTAYFCGTPSRPPSPGCIPPSTTPTGAVAGQQGVAIEAGGTDLAAWPSGVAQAATAGTRQGVAVAEEQVGVTIAAAVTRLAGAAQHQRVPEEAGRTPGSRAGRGHQWSVARGPHPRVSWGQHSGPAPLPWPQLTAHRRRLHNQVCRGTGCGRLAGHSPRRSCKDQQRQSLGPWQCPGPGEHTVLRLEHTPGVWGPDLTDTPSCPGLCRGQWEPIPPRGEGSVAPSGLAYLLEGTERGQGQLTQGALGSSLLLTKPAWQRSH